MDALARIPKHTLWFIILDHNHAIRELECHDWHSDCCGDEVWQQESESRASLEALTPRRLYKCPVHNLVLTVHGNAFR